MLSPLNRSATGSEPRHRLPSPPDLEAPRRLPSVKDKKKPSFPLAFVKDPNFHCKNLTLKISYLSLILLASCTLIAFFQIGRSLSSRFTESARSKARYAAQISVNWPEIASALDSLSTSRGRDLMIGLVNFNKHEEIYKWIESTGQKHSAVLRFAHVDEDLLWEDLYPEWIDEEEINEIPKCPAFPMPNMRDGTRLDVVVVKVPCSSSLSWTRDVARLHVQLVAAHVAVSSRAEYVLALDVFRPLPNLFTCSHVVKKMENAFFIKADLPKLRKKLALPIGSCELSVPLEGNVPYGTDDKRSRSREAYVTILHSAQFYVCGAITVAQSIRLSGSTRDLVILVDNNIQPHHRKGLEAAGWKVIMIERIRNPKAERDAYNEWNYSKFRLWQLTAYDKIIFIDADLLILRNIDFLFRLPEISATGNNATLFNSGVMVVEPSNCTFQLLMDEIDNIVSYNGGDQGYLNEIFTWWHRIPKRMNYLKHFWANETEEYMEKTRLFGAEPPELYALHYLGLKPWVCFRDYDCNWNVENQRMYASDVAHAAWWKVHDTLPEELQQFCLLRSKQKASLEWDRLQAQNGSFSDEHWKRNITDPRLKICNDNSCFWQSMLWHWGDPKYDG